jgi:hypothetical protein
MTAATTYEVEIRFCAANAAEAYALLPFLAASLGPEKAWSTQILGRALYTAGHLLRVGRSVLPTGADRYYLGYKGLDEGHFANIRQEWGEEITTGAPASVILARLGIDAAFATPQAVIEGLEQAGHTPFMDFTGVDRLGHDATLGVDTKLMRCPKILGDQVLVELELGATSYAEALAAEQQLQALAERYQITDRLLRAEPPTLLYGVTFPQG